MQSGIPELPGKYDTWADAFRAFDLSGFDHAYLLHANVKYLHGKNGKTVVGNAVNLLSRKKSFQHIDCSSDRTAVYFRRMEKPVRFAPPKRSKPLSKVEPNVDVTNGRPYMKEYRELHFITLHMMSKRALCSVKLLKMLEEDATCVTHPHIAKRVAKAYGLTREQFIEMLPANYRPGDDYAPDKYKLSMV